MRQRRIACLAALLGLGALLPSCTVGTRLANSWSDPTAKGRTFRHVVVFAVTPRMAARQTYEDALVQDLTARSIPATASHTFTGDERIMPDSAQAVLMKLGADAVIVTRLLDQTSVQMYYFTGSPTPDAPSQYTQGWYRFYSLPYANLGQPTFDTDNQVYSVETNLYDLQGDHLVWSARTESTVHRYDAPETEIHPMIDQLVQDLEHHGLLPAGRKP